MEEALTTEEFKALEAAGYKPSGGGIFGDEIKLRFVQGGVPLLGTRAEWRAILAGLPPVADIYEEYGRERIRGDQLFGIAADLLEACEAFCAKYSSGKPVEHVWEYDIAQLRAAIAKAKADAAQGD